MFYDILFLNPHDEFENTIMNKKNKKNVESNNCESQNPYIEINLEEEPYGIEIVNLVKVCVQLLLNWTILRSLVEMQY